MWKVGDVNPVNVLGVDGYPYGFQSHYRGRPAARLVCLRERAKAEESRCTHSVGYRGCC